MAPSSIHLHQTRAANAHFAVAIAFVLTLGSVVFEQPCIPWPTLDET